MAAATRADHDRTRGRYARHRSSTDARHVTCRGQPLGLGARCGAGPASGPPDRAAGRGPRGEAEWMFLDGVAAAMNGSAREVEAARRQLRQSNAPGAAAAADALDAHLLA